MTGVLVLFVDWFVGMETRLFFHLK